MASSPRSQRAQVFTVTPSAVAISAWVRSNTVLKLPGSGCRPTLLRVFYVDAGGGEAVVVSFYRTTQVARYWRTDE